MLTRGFLFGMAVYLCLVAGGIGLAIGFMFTYITSIMYVHISSTILLKKQSNIAKNIASIVVKNADQ